MFLKDYNSQNPLLATMTRGLWEHLKNREKEQSFQLLMSMRHRRRAENLPNEVL